MLTVELLGVRGSMPSPGEDTVIFGGNTSCVLLTSNQGDELILDCGTGIFQLNNRFDSHNRPINMLITHNHWDHIQGFPFFKPIYQSGRKIHVVVGDVEGASDSALLLQMSGTMFPVKFSELPASIHIDVISATLNNFAIGNFNITTMPLNHPGGGSAYCIDYMGTKVAYITDNELNPPGKINTTIEQWADFIRGADLLIHDAQFTDEDIENKLGWGHSTVDQVADLACQGNVKSVVIISHDPLRTDSALLNIEHVLKTQYADILNIECGREGTLFHL